MERDRHEIILNELIGATVSDGGRVLLVDGLPGTGRSALLDRAVTLAERAGLLVMRASCSPMERELAGSVLTQLLHNVPVPDDLTGPEVPGHREFCRTVHHLAADRPLLVAVDDLHDADERSVHSLLYLARRVDTARVLLVMTCEREGLRPAPGFIAALRDEPRVHRLGVEPLSPAGTARLVAAHGHAASAAEFHHRSGGNPGLLAALLDDHRSVDDRYPDTVVRLLRRTDTTTLRVANAIAVLGRMGTPERVARLAGLDRGTGAATAERAVRALTATGLLRSDTFPHPAGRGAVLAALPTEERAALHQRVAELLHTAGEPTTAVATHLLDSGRPADPWAVPVLTEAAEHLLLAGEDERAARFLELAAESCHRPADRAPVLARYADALWRRNPLLAAQHLPQLVAAARAGHLDRHTSAELVRKLLWHGRIDDAAAVVGRLWETAGPESGEGGVRALEAWAACTHAPLAVRRPARSAAPDPTAGGDPGLASAAAMASALRSGHLARDLEQVARVLGRPRPATADGWTREAAVLALTGLLDVARPRAVVERCAELTSPDDATGAPAWHAEVTAIRAEALLRAGDLTGAHAAATTALSVLPARAWGVAVGLPLATLITAAVRSGRLDEAASHLATVPPEAMFRTRYGLYYRYARGEHHLAAGNAYGAVTDFTACGDLVRLLGLEAAPTVPWRVGAALAWRQLGHEDRARRLVRDALSGLPRAAGGRARGAALRVLAAVSRPDRRPALLQEAVELFEECGDQYGQAQALTDLGLAFAALEDGRRTRTTLRRARHLASSCEARPLCDELLAMLEPTEQEAGRGGGGRGLTDSERRVAHLAVLGYTNREIAAKLYVTASTVEQHLTRVFRKLDVKRRKDLPADLGAGAFPGEPEWLPQPASR
ncbi:helix-turn-helix transcriptional regulator [Actinophytocola sp.]|uniref:helix-turn-helix transcriptional regulator n=1 Tax=Actinophytocola sp. TaxID=1872138 RepID=UPI002D228ABC|nr:AAA family ATPase [Actinophytocola sp.]HYQ68095.1 AAA family ATPase [Actinophytocola sp.]